MIELNHTHLASLFFEGFRFVIYMPKDDFGLVKPIKNDASEAWLKSFNAYQIAITEREVLDMADGQWNFKIYITENLFITE
jgi:hypothetical protein